MLLLKLFLFILFETITIVYCAPSALADTDLPIVKTNMGDIRGTIATTLLDQRKFLSFRGIPYAKSPVGPLRFRVSMSQLIISKWGDKSCAEKKYLF